MNQNFLLAVAMLAGTIMGAGIFSLPYVFGLLGVGLGTLYLVFFAGVYCVVHLMFAHILRESSGAHELPYITGEYLGRAMGRLATATILTELTLVLTAYLALVPSFLSIMFGSSHALGVVAFWAVSSAFIFVSLKWLGFADLVGVLGIISVVSTVFYFGSGHPLTVLPPQAFTWTVGLLPFGPLLFAFSGRPAIFKVVEEWRAARRPFPLFLAVILGTLIPAAIYYAFVMGVLRLNPAPSSDAVTALLGMLPYGAYLLLGVMGLVALWKSYFMIGSDVREILRRDLRASPLVSALIVLAAPHALYWLGASHFFTIIGFVGGIFLALEGIYVVAVWRKKFHAHPLRFMTPVLYLIFSLAIAYEVVHIFS